MKNLFVTFLLLSTFSCTSQTKDCSEFKTGTFKYVDSNLKYTITRTDSTQIEFNEETNIKIISNLKWISDCEYILTYRDIKNYPNKDEIIGKKITVKIIEANGNNFTALVKSDAVDSQIEFIKIKALD